MIWDFKEFKGFGIWGILFGRIEEGVGLGRSWVRSGFWMCGICWLDWFLVGWFGIYWDME